MAQNNKKQKVKFPSELRLDMVSNDWVVIATGRAKRPETFKQEKREVKRFLAKNVLFVKLLLKRNRFLFFLMGKKLPLRIGRVFLKIGRLL